MKKPARGLLLYAFVSLLHSVASETDGVAREWRDIGDEMTLSNATETTGNVSTQPSMARTLGCIPILRLFNVELKQPLRADERVGLAGSHRRLGEWRVEHSLAMKRRDRNGLRWYIRLMLCASERIYYRYFIYYEDEHGNRRIRNWEGHPHARVLNTYAISRQMDWDRYGEVYSMWQPTEVEQERGWLRCEYMLELKFVWERHLHFTAFARNHTREAKYLLKLYVQRIGGSAAGIAQTSSDIEVEISRYAYKRAQFRPQRERGVAYTAGDIVIFRVIQSLDSAPHFYEFTIASMDGRPLALAAITDLDLHSSSGLLQLPLEDASDGFEIGYLKLPYLIVRPLAKPSVLNFRTSFQHYWPRNWPIMDVGHRGAGSSYYHSKARYTENTIKSMQYAQNTNADMVELDVQPTLDYVPVLWNERGFYTAPHNRRVRKLDDLQYVLIKRLTYKELKSKRVFVHKQGSIVEVSKLNVRRRSRERERIFPTLAEVYRALPNTLGLIIEIKWQQSFRSGIATKFKRYSLLDKNRFVDHVIQLSLTVGCGRPIIFSSFDADICTILRHKQQLFSVIFLSSGETALWQPYRDLRTVTLRDAVNFAQSEGLLGTGLHANHFIGHSLATMELGLRLSQAVFVWGRHLNSTLHLRKFRHAVPSGLIYDRVERHVPEKRAAFFQARQLQEIYERQCFNGLANYTTSAAEEGCMVKKPFKIREAKEKKRWQWWRFYF